MEQFLHRVATPLNAARERPSTSATLRCWRAGQEAAKASRPASPTSRQPRTESLRSPWRNRPRAARPESVTEHLPRSKERSLQQLPAKLARLEKKKIEIHLLRMECLESTWCLWSGGSHAGWGNEVYSRVWTPGGQRGFNLEKLWILSWTWWRPWSVIWEHLAMERYLKDAFSFVFSLYMVGMCGTGRTW